MDKEEDKQEFISIKFVLKSPTNFRESAINTLVHLLREISDLEKQQEWDKIGTIILNNKIEVAKRELENLKVIEFRED